MPRMRSTPLLFVTLFACGSSSSSSSSPPVGGHPTVEAAVQAFESALVTGDAAKVRGQLASRAALDSIFDCGAAMEQTMDDTAKEIVKIGDVKAMVGRKPTFEGLASTEIKKVPVGRFEEICDVHAAFQLAKVEAKWKLEGESHTTRLTLIESGGRWYAFDVPGF